MQEGMLHAHCHKAFPRHPWRLLALPVLLQMLCVPARRLQLEHIRLALCWLVVLS
jgi:hypothetical protein